MTFYQELKAFFLKHDRDRLYMAKKIANTFPKKNQQKVALKRLDIIYKNGGPANIEIDENRETPVLETVEEQIENAVDSKERVAQEVVIETEAEENTPQDIVIETDEDEEKA